MDGRVMAVGGELVVLALVSDDIIFNGFVVLRAADLTFVKSPAPYAAFKEKVLAARGGEPRFTLPSKTLSWRGVLQSAAQFWPLTAVHAEVAEPDMVFIGQVATIPAGAAEISIKLVGPDGKWKKKPRVLPITDISRIDFGGRYEEALAIAVGLAPGKTKVARSSRTP